jgi:hypothetical protein
LKGKHLQSLGLFFIVWNELNNFIAKTLERNNHILGVILGFVHGIHHPKSWVRRAFEYDKLETQLLDNPTPLFKHVNLTLMTTWVTCSQTYVLA